MLSARQATAHNHESTAAVTTNSRASHPKSWWRWGDALQSPPLLVVTSCWGREDHYFLKLWPLFGSHSLLDGPTPLHIQAALTGLSGLPKKKK